MIQSKKKLVRKPNFKNQVTRLDVLENMIHRHDYQKILTNNYDKNNDKRYQGFVYETVSIILMITKCLNVHFSKMNKIAKTFNIFFKNEQNR